MAADDGLVSLRHFELAAGLIPLAEEVADELLGAITKGVVVLRHVLGLVIPTEIKNRLGLIENEVVDCIRYITPGDNEELVGGTFACTLVARHC